MRLCSKHIWCRIITERAFGVSLDMNGLRLGSYTDPTRFWHKAHSCGTMLYVGCVLPGLVSAIYAIDKGKNWGLLFTYIFVILLISAGVRAGFYGVAIAFFLYSVWSKNFFT